MKKRLQSRRTHPARDCTAARGLGIKTTLLLLSALLLASLVRLAAAEPKPNVLLILSDDHSYPHVGCTVSESGKLGHVTLQADRTSGDHRTIAAPFKLIVVPIASSGHSLVMKATGELIFRPNAPSDRASAQARRRHA